MIAQALAILDTRPGYRALLGRAYPLTDLIPAADAGRLWVTDEAFGTWYTPEMPMTEPPKYQDWYQRGGLTYIIDVVVTPGASGFKAGRELVRHIKSQRNDGPIAFWRLHSNRWGVVA